MRIVDYTGGEREDLTAVITDKYGEDLTAVTFAVGLGTATVKPAAWAAADIVTLSGANNSIARVSMFIDVAGDIGADKRLWVKATDVARVYFLVCSNEAVTVT